MRAGARGAVVVTGASKGIGRACALRLERLGFHVFAGIRNPADGDALLEASAGGLRPLRIDVADPDSIAAAEREVAAEVGADGLAALVNNAGISIAGPLEFLPVDELRRQLEVNVIGQLAVTQAFMPAIRRARGRIVFMGSISGRSALPFTGAYSASKHALEAVADALRVELLPWRIEVSLVEPGVIATPIWKTSARVAERIMERYPAQALEYYGGVLDRMRRIVEDAATRGLSPDRVARTVAHALTARRPRTRYLVGRDARLRIWFQRLPDRLRDRIIAARLRRGIR